MDILTFIAHIIGSLAWPATLLVVLRLALRHGRQIARFVKSIKYKDLEVTLKDDFEEAKKIANRIEVQVVPLEESNVPNEAENKVLQLAQIDPGVAILKSWQKLEAQLSRMIQYNGLMRFANPDRFVRRLVQLQLLTLTDTELYKRLRVIRNEAVHVQRNVTIAEAVEYDQLVETLARRLEQAHQAVVSNGSFVAME